MEMKEFVERKGIVDEKESEESMERRREWNVNRL